MRAVDLGHGLFAFEPEGRTDQVGSLDDARLKTLGLSEAMIRLYHRYSALTHRSVSADDTKAAQGLSYPLPDTFA